jgi:alanyl-tRNA synthetase
MTTRLYYHDAYLTSFTAHVLELGIYEGRTSVVLDQTGFYPTSGGQPFDKGFLAGEPVMDVVLREGDDAVLHILEGPWVDKPREVIGEIDWQRRFDHMQQHTGQHILSQAFIQVADAATVAFHLGTESATVDLEGGHRLTPEAMRQAEELSNTIIWEDRSVTARIFKPEELSELPLRKPPVVTGDVRLIQVADFDWSACGGTHVARTGEIGSIKIVKWERRGAEMRVEFLCGQRALADYARKNHMIQKVSGGLNVGYWELDQAVDRLVAETKELRAHLRRAGRSLATYRAQELREKGIDIGGLCLVVHNASSEPETEIRELARQLVSEPRVIALLGSGSEKARFCFAHSGDLDINMVPIVQELAVTLGSRGGGGSPDFAQAGGVLENAQLLDSMLAWAADRVRQQLERVS